MPKPAQSVRHVTSAWSALPQDDVWAWFLRLRWGACLGQSVAICSVRFLLGLQLPLLPLMLLVAAEAATNLWLLGLHQRQRHRLNYGVLTAVTVADVVVVTGLVALTGGPRNPFANIYVVHVALAATILPTAGTLTVMAAATLGFASLFCWHLPLPALRDVVLTPLYLQGLGAAFAAAVLFIAYFVGRIQLALARSEARLAVVRERAVRDEKLNSLATLAAGAAHELSTPLATIAVVAKEMQRALHRPADQELLPTSLDAVREDARLIRREVNRCRDVLRHMAHDAGETCADGFVRIDAASLVQEALSELPRASSVQVQVDKVACGDLYLPVRSVAHSLRAVVNNALDASLGAGRLASAGPQDLGVAVRVAQVDQICYISIADKGCGMADHVLARAGEPFFTTKGPGHGMGLGLFLARTVLERLGGGLRVDSHLGAGTTVVMQLPLAAPSIYPGALNA